MILVMEAMGRGSSGLWVYTTVSVSRLSMKRDLQWGPWLSSLSQLKVKPSAEADRGAARSSRAASRPAASFFQIRMR